MGFNFSQGGWGDIVSLFKKKLEYRRKSVLPVRSMICCFLMIDTPKYVLQEEFQAVTLIHKLAG